MSISHVSRLCLLLALAFGLTAAVPSLADAQKKTTKSKPAATQKKAPEKQQAEEPKEEEEVKSDEPAPTPAPQANPATGGVLTWLRKYTGEKTNLGKLKEVTAQYIVVEEDNTTTIIPLGMIHSLRQVKEEDPPSVRLEIFLTRKD